MVGCVKGCHKNVPQGSEVEGGDLGPGQLGFSEELVLHPSTWYQPTSSVSVQIKHIKLLFLNYAQHKNCTNHINSLIERFFLRKECSLVKCNVECSVCPTKHYSSKLTKCRLRDWNLFVTYSPQPTLTWMILKQLLHNSPGPGISIYVVCLFLCRQFYWRY